MLPSRSRRALAIGRGLRRAPLAAAFAALVCLFALPVSASAFTEPGFTGTFSDFANCPANLSGLEGCLHAYITGGEIEIGDADVPISLPGDTLDLAWYGKGDEACEPIDQLYGAGEGCILSPSHGILSGPAQPVPGGLLGDVGADALTGVQARLEWAQPLPADTVFGIFGGEAPDMLLNQYNLLQGEGLAMRLAVRVHLISPFLGPDCYIGSAFEPLALGLTTGSTNPPPPNQPIAGRAPGPLILVEEDEILQSYDVQLVDDSFSVPAAGGCGTLMDAAIDQRLGLPSPAGQNTVVIDSESEQTGAQGLLEHGWSEAWGEPAAQQLPNSEPEPSALPAEPSTAPAPAPALQLPVPQLTAPLSTTRLSAPAVATATITHPRARCSKATRHPWYSRTKRCATRAASSRSHPKHARGKR